MAYPRWRMYDYDRLWLLLDAPAQADQHSIIHPLLMYSDDGEWFALDKNDACIGVNDSCRA